MILAGASADDVFVIVLFTSFTGIALGGTFEAVSLMRIPSSILLGIAGGMGAGYALHRFLSRIELSIVKTLILFLSTSFLLVTLEDAMDGIVGFSGLIAVMAMGMMYARKAGTKAERLSQVFSKMWVAAELFLFVLVGAAVDISYAFQSGFAAILLILMVLLFRMLGVAVCVMGTKLNRKERLFCMIAYTPKATVQAAIGAIPLAMGLSSGNTILTIAVIAILLTAPLGAFLIDLGYKKLLAV
jgi:NhaP-type Na+/H+ or K+/H+ antiporter